MEQIERLYLLLLAGLMVFPGLGLYYEINAFDNCDNRELQSFPEFTDNAKFLDDFEAYFKDHVPYRNILVHLNSKIKYSLFNSSPKPENTLVGNDGFIHYSSLTDQEMASYSRKNLCSKEELVHLKKKWENRTLQLNKSNTQYFMAVWPNKTTVYEETLPFSMKLQKADTLSKLDQVLQYMKQESAGIKILDVRENLLNKKSTEDIYLKHDTHWNALGAFYAYQQLMLHMGINPYELSDFELNRENTTEGDLKKMTGLCNDNSIMENIPTLTIKEFDGKIVRADHPTDSRFIITNDQKTLNRSIVIFRDSFTSALMPFISLHFKECHVIWSGYNQDIVDRIKPDIVLVAKTERYF